MREEARAERPVRAPGDRLRRIGERSRRILARGEWPDQRVDDRRPNDDGGILNGNDQIGRRNLVRSNLFSSRRSCSPWEVRVDVMDVAIDVMSSGDGRGASKAAQNAS
jgi:hypothetical protein